MERFLEGCKLTLASIAVASAGTAVNGATLDMQGYDGVLCCGVITTANAGNFLKGQQGELANASDMADLAGTKVVAVANAQIVVLEVNRVRERYFRGVIVRAGANTAIETFYYIQYSAGNKPTVSDVTNVLLSLQVQSPLEGTP